MRAWDGVSFWKEEDSNFEITEAVRIVGGGYRIMCPQVLILRSNACLVIERAFSEGMVRGPVGLGLPNDIAPRKILGPLRLDLSSLPSRDTVMRNRSLLDVFHVGYVSF